MFDRSEEERDEENQIKKGTPATSDDDSARSAREGTPGPQVASDEIKQSTSGHEGASHGAQTEIKGVVDTVDKKDK